MRYYSGYSLDYDLWIQHMEGFVNHSEYLHINGCGYQSINMDVYNNYPYRIDYQLIYVLKGKAYPRLNNKIRTINEGELFLFFPGEEEYYEYHKDDYPEVYWMHFTGFGAEKLMTELGFSTDSRIVNVGSSEEYNEMFEKIIYELQAKKPAYIQFANSYFYELLAHFLRSNSYPSLTYSYQKVFDLYEVVGHMNKNLNIKMTVADYAKLCCVSVNKFILDFKEFTGLTPCQYLTKIRLEKAKELLLVTAFSVSDISHMIGYDDQLYFCRIFKKYSGFSPTDYKVRFTKITYHTKQISS